MMFAALPKSLQDTLSASAPERRLDAGQIIQQRGDKAAGFWLITAGSVAVGQYLRDGEFRAVAVLGPGDSWGELAMFARRPRVVDAVARTRCTLRYIAEETFEAALAANPASMRALLGALSAQLQEILDITTGIRSGSAKRRVAALLSNLANGVPDPVRIDMSQTELAELLGISRMTVNSALGAFARDGLITRHYGSVEIVDREGLEFAALD